MFASFVVNYPRAVEHGRCANERNQMRYAMRKQTRPSVAGHAKYLYAGIRPRFFIMNAISLLIRSWHVAK